MASGGRAEPFVIYYGWLTDDAGGEPNEDARRIAAVRPPLLIAHLRTAPPAGHLNLSPPVLDLLRSIGTQVLGYVATDFGRAELGLARRAVTENLDAGLDGIFFDEADSLAGPAKFGYYAMLAQPVRQRGRKTVLNAGVSKCGERMMQVADLVMVEHEWRTLRRDSPWAGRYDPARFMGVSSNEGNAMGYHVDAQHAIEDSREAHSAGIGWHAATDRYIELPPWFETYFASDR